MDSEDKIITQKDKIGKVMIKLPCPPGHMDGLWNNDQAYMDKYLATPEGYYMTGDAGYFDAEGYMYIMTRTDDVINTAGHRISTGRIEEVISDHKFVAECAVVGKEDSLKGHVPIAYVVLQREIAREKMVKELQ
jgi:propionyl-CoA synthetase